jgi:DNA-directed RNA polymerase specialized sigma24 family protein
MTEQWWLDMDDPLQRYEHAGRLQAEHEAALSRIVDLKARALAELRVDGWTFAKIGEATKLSKQRVHQLVERGMDVIP